MLNNINAIHLLPEGEYIFQLTGHPLTWLCIRAPKFEGIVLADFLSSIDVYVDYGTQFLRIKRYDEDLVTTFEYRAYSQARVKINIYHTKF